MATTFVYIIATTKRETEKAILAATPMERGPKWNKDVYGGTTWLPKSQISVFHKWSHASDGSAVYQLPLWLARKNGLAYYTLDKMEEFIEWCEGDTPATMMEDADRYAL